MTRERRLQERQHSLRQSRADHGRRAFPVAPILRAAQPLAASGQKPMIGYLSGFLAAVANTSSKVLNRKATQEEPTRVEFRLKTDPGSAAASRLADHRGDHAGVVHPGATALGPGQLAAVQVIIILELPLTLIGGAKFLASRLGRREWADIAGLTGVIGLLACLDPQSGPTGRSPPHGGSSAPPPPVTLSPSFN